MRKTLRSLMRSRRMVRKAYREQFVRSLSFEPLEGRRLLTGEPFLVGGVNGANAGPLEVGADLKLTFSEPVESGVGGSVSIYRSSGRLLESFSVGSPRLHFDAAESSLSIDPTWDLDGGSAYFVNIDSGAVRSASSKVAFGGLTDSSTLAFLTGVETTDSFGDSTIRDRFPGTSSDTIGDLHVLYIRATYTDVNRATNTLYEAQQDMEQSSVGWIETSKGRMPMTTIYTPVVSLPFSHSWMMTFDKSVNALGLVHQAAQAEASKLGYDMGDYDMLVVRLDTSLRDGASYGGGGNAWLAWGGEGVMLHEGGHALGLGHARSVSFDGTVVEYGNYIDWMGGGGGMAAEYGASTQVGLGWIDSTGVLTNPGPGTYRIYAMDDGRTQVGRSYLLKQNVPKDVLSSTGASYSLEYRPRLGPTFAAFALLQRNSQLVDLVPSTWQQEDAGIQVGQTVRIPGSDSYFSVVGLGDGYIDVAYREGVFSDNYAPSASFSASATAVKRFDSVTFAASAVDANADSLGYLWIFSDGVIGSGATYTRSFNQSASSNVTVTLTVSDLFGGSTTVAGVVAVGASSTGSPGTFGTMNPPASTSLPKVSVSAPGAFANEGGDVGVFTFRRVGTSNDQPLTLQLLWSGSASASNDFVNLPTSVTIPSGSTSVDLALIPVDDTAIEPNKILAVEVKPDAAYNVSSQSSAAFFSLGDDDTPVVTIQAIDSWASEPTIIGRENGSFLISRTGPTDTAMTVYYGLGGTAANGSDYGRLDGQTVIPAGMSSVVLSVVPVDDSEGEIDETVDVRIASFNSVYSVGAASSATVTIHDNGDLPTVSVRATTSRTTEGGSVVFALTAAGGNSPITVQYTIAGTATSGVDFQSLTGSVVIPAGVGLRTVNIPVQTIADSVNENDESVTFQINTSSSYSLGIDPTAMATIEDVVNESTGGDRIRVSRDFSGSSALSLFDSIEGSAPASFFIYCDNNTIGRGAVTVTFALSGTAIPGVDYTGRILDVNRNQIGTFTPASSNTVTIPANAVLLSDGSGPDGDRKQGVVIVLDPVADNTFEGTESVVLTINSAAGSKSFYPLGFNRSVSVNLIDGDTSATRVGFETASTLVSEGNSREIAVTLNQAASVPVTVHYRSSGGSAIGLGADWAFIDKANGNAEVLDGWLTFAPGEVRKSINVSVLKDRISEDSERFGITLEYPVGASIESSSRTHSVTVYDVVPEGLVKEERWSGTSVFSNGTWDSVRPDTVGYLTGLTSLQNVGDNYSRRLTGLITAPATGSYTFYASGDDDVKLYLGASELASSKSLIASVPTGSWTGFQQWNKYSSQQSAAISLVAGQKYYVEVQHKEGSGGDHVSIGWTGPGISSITPITTAVPAPDTINRYVGFVTGETILTEGQSKQILLALDRPNLEGSVSVDVQRLAGASATDGADYNLSFSTVVFGPGETTKIVDFNALTDSSGESVEIVSLRLANAVGARVANTTDHAISIVDALAPSLRSVTGYVSSGAASGTLVAQAIATPAANGTISGMSILSGNPQLSGSSTAAFAIDLAGRITVANPAAIPTGSYELRLTLKASDISGASTLGYATVIVNGSAIREERWDLTTAYDSNDWTAAPSVTNTLASFASPQDVGDYYSRRISGVFIPTTSGDYSFWIAARDSGKLTIAPLSDSANEKTIATSPGVDYQAWDVNDSQQSAPQSLVAGTAYIVRAYQKENYWGDHLSVAWAGPGFSRQVVPASSLLRSFADRVLPAPSPSESTPPAVASFSISTTALTDAGASPTISAGQFTRDQTLGLSGTAVPGGSVTVYEGAIALGNAVVSSSGSWSFTTSTLTEGDHTFRAEIVDTFGNVGITASVTFTVRSKIEIGNTQLLSHDIGVTTGTSAGPMVGDVAGFSSVNQGVVVYSVPTGSSFQEQIWSSDSVYDNGSWDSVAPSSSSSLMVLSTAQNVGNNYSRRIRGTLTVPVSGTYTFYIASDDNSRLYISSDDTAANKTQIASVSGWTDFQQWNKYSSQKSAGITLQANKNYYIEVQHQEWGGGDHVSVGWTGPGIGSITPVAIRSNLVVADGASGQTQMVNRSVLDPNTSGSSAVDYAGISADGMHVFFSSSAVSSFGNSGASFSDTNVLSASPASDLFDFDRTTGSIRLLTSGSSANTSNSRQSKFVGVTADSRYAVYKTDYVENIGSFTAPGKPTPSTWSLVDGGYPNASGKLKTTSLTVADIDPTKFVYNISGGYITNQGLTASVSSPTVERATGSLTFWVQGYDDGSTKAVKLEISDVIGGILVKATAAKYVSGNQSNYDWRTNGSNGSVASSGSAAGYGVSTLEARGSNLNAKMLSEGAVPSTDLVAFDLVTGSQRLLTHSSASSGLESQAANVSNVLLAGNGRYAIFTALDASKLGNSGVAFTDATPTVSDLFAVDVQNGQIRLLSHGTSSVLASAGGSVTLQGISDDGNWAIFSANDATAFGFTDSSVSSSDLFAADLADGTIRLLSRSGATATTTTSGQAVSFEKISGNHVYFYANDATKLGFSSDLDTSKADLFRYSLQTGSVELISHAATSSNQALGAAYYPGSLTVSPDGRYVAFAVNLQSSGGGFTAGVSGSALMMADMNSNAIRMLNSGNAEGSSLSYGAWGSIQNKSRYFTPDSTKFIWQTEYIGWVASDVSGYSSGLNGYSSATLLTDLSSGLVAYGTSSIPKILNHSASSLTQLAPSGSLLGVSSDSRLVYFASGDATRFGNDGVAFTDGDTVGTDIFAIQLGSRAIDLVSGQSGASYGQKASFVGISQGGSVTLGIGNVSGIGSLQGTLTDANGGTDLLTRRFNMISLVGNAGIGNSNLNQLSSGNFALDSAVSPGIAVRLLDNGSIVDSRSSAQTTASGGLIRWQLSNVAVGSHLYSLQFVDEQIPIRLASLVGTSELTVIVTNENSAPTDLSLSNATLPENSGLNAVIGLFSTSDPDTGNTFTYTLVSGVGSTDNASFNISGSSLRASSSFNYESKNVYAIRVRSTDQSGLYAEKSFTISVSDINEFMVSEPVDSDSSGNRLNVTDAIGTFVGIKAYSVDADGTNNAVSYSLVDNAGGLFSINAQTGNIYLAGSLLNITSSTQTIVARATSSDGSSASKSFTIAIDSILSFTGSTGNDQFKVRQLGSSLWTVERNNTVLYSGFVGSLGNISIDALDGADTLTLYGTDNQDSFSINSGSMVLNSVSVIGTSIESRYAYGQGLGDTFSIYSSIQGIYGGDGQDRFKLADSTLTVDLIDGGNQYDTLDYSLRSSAISLNIGGSSAPGVSSVTGVDSWIGSQATDTLVGQNVLTDWAITGINTTQVNLIDYSSFENLSGGTAVDRFKFWAATSKLTGLISGGLGNDQITAYNSTNTWNLTGSKEGNIVGGGAFVGVENLLGGTNADTFIVQPAAMFTTVDGSDGDDQIDYSSFGSAVAINTGLRSATALGMYNSIESFLGSNANDSFTSGNTANNWVINGAGSGTLSYGTSLAARFSSFETVKGGGLADVFKIDSGSIPNILAGAGVDTIIGPSQTNTWRISGTGVGTLNGSTIFREFENVTGGDQDDKIEFAGSGLITGLLSGGNGINTLSYQTLTSSQAVTVNSTQGVASRTGSISADFQIIIGGAGNDYIRSFTGVDSVLVGNGGDDSLYGSSGRDILIGGLGVDYIYGGGGDDVLIGGYTSYDNDLVALKAIRSEWTSSRNYLQRLGNIRGSASSGTPLNSGYYFRNNVSDTIFDDSSVDSLYGQADQDWFISSGSDLLPDFDSSIEQALDPSGT